MPNLRDLDVRWVSLVDRAAVRNAENPTEPQRFLVWKSDRGEHDPEGGSMTEAEMQAAVEKSEADAAELQAKLTKAEEDRDALNERVEKLEKAEPKTDDAKPEDKPVNKADLTPEVRALVEKAEENERVAKAEREALAKRVDDAETIAKAERDERVTREFVAKAEQYRGLSIEPAKFGPILKAASEKLTKDESEELDRVLKAADAAIATSELLKAYGRDGEPAVSTGEDTLTRKAEEIRKADPSLSGYEAMRRAMRDDPAAQADYLQTVR